jgi:WD40 repeat protein
MEIIYTLKHSKTVSKFKYLSVSLKIKKKEELIITGTEDHALNIYDIKTGEFLHKLEMHTNRIKDISVEKILYDEFLIVSADSDGGIAIWRVSKDHALLEGYDMTGVRITCLSHFANGLKKQVEFMENQKKLKEKINEDDDENDKEENDEEENDEENNEEEDEENEENEDEENEEEEE